MTTKALELQGYTNKRGIKAVEVVQSAVNLYEVSHEADDERLTMTADSWLDLQAALDDQYQKAVDNAETAAEIKKNGPGSVSQIKDALDSLDRFLRGGRSILKGDRSVVVIVDAEATEAEPVAVAA